MSEEENSKCNYTMATIYSAPEMEKIVPKLQKTMKNIEILHACTLLGYHDFESPLALFFSLLTLPALVQ